MKSKACSPDKNREIIEAARSLFAEFGFKKVTIDDIAARLGITRTALYYYYKDKEAIFAAVLEGEIEEYVKELEQEIARGKTTDERIENFCRQYFLLRKKFVNLFKLTISEYAQNLKVQDVLKSKLLSANKAAVESILSSELPLPKKCDRSYAAKVLTSAIGGVSRASDVFSLDEAETNAVFIFKTFVAGLISGKVKVKEQS